MRTLHPDAPAIDRLGSAAICERFAITRQAVSYWRRKGVPRKHRKAMMELAANEGCKVPEMRKSRNQD